MLVTAVDRVESGAAAEPAGAPVLRVASRVIRQDWRSLPDLNYVPMGHSVFTISGYIFGMNRSLLPSVRRIRAFAVSPATAVAVFLLEEPQRGYPSAPVSLRLNLEIFSLIYCFVGVPITAIFGCGAYMLLKEQLRGSVLRCVIAGAIIGTLPAMALMLFSHTGSGADVVMTQPGGMLSEVAATAVLATEVAIAGAAGGFAFWLSAGADFRRRQPNS